RSDRDWSSDVCSSDLRSRVYVSEITFGYCGVLATTPHIGPASCRSGDLFVAEGGHGVEARSAAGRPKAGGQADRGQNEDGKSKRSEERRVGKGGRERY